MLAVGADDEDAVVFAYCPILALDFHAGFGGKLVEGMGAGGGFFEILRSLIGEAKQTDVSGHDDLFLRGGFWFSIRGRTGRAGRPDDDEALPVIQFGAFVNRANKVSRLIALEAMSILLSCDLSRGELQSARIYP